MIYLPKLATEASQLQKALKDFDFEKAQETAVYLIEEGNKLIQKEVQGLDNQFIPLPIALQVIESLAEESIQYCDKIKYVLSKASRIFAELLLFQTFAKERRIYSDTQETMIEQLEKVQSTLPETEIGTSFEVQCALEAIKGLVPGEGLFTELAKKEGKDLFRAGISAIIFPSRVVAPALKMLESLYNKLGDTSYVDLFTLRWECTNLTHYVSFKTIHKSIGNIKDIRDKGENFSLCVAEIFMDILSHKAADKELKMRVFNGTKPPKKREIEGSEGKIKKSLGEQKLATLLDLADLISVSHELATVDVNRFWKTRYRVIEHLNFIAKEKEVFFPGEEGIFFPCVGKLSSRLSCEKNKQTLGLLLTISKERMIQEKEQAQASRVYSKLCAENQKAIIDQEKNIEIQLEDHIKKEKLNQDSTDLLKRASKLENLNQSTAGIDPIQILAKLEELSKQERALKIESKELKAQKENLELIRSLASLSLQ